MSLLSYFARAVPMVFIALIIHRLTSLPSSGIGLCPPHGPARSACHFSEDYFEARSKFRAAAAKAGAELHTLTVALPDYTTDIAVLAGRGPGLVVHSSGVHGVEGFAGSGIQIAILSNFSKTEAAEAQSTDPDAPTIVLVHAVNPFGMAHFRRFNENNVDLNRNALPPADRAAVLARDTNIAGYFDFAALFNPPQAPTVLDAYLVLPLRLVRLLARHGFTKMKRSLVAAQYTDARGIFYGGRSLEPSHRLLFEWFERFAGSDSDTTTSKQVKRGVTWIDVHTGLGTSGEDTLLTDESEREFRQWYPDAPKVQNQHAGEGDVGVGYELTVGFQSQLFQTRFPGEARLQHFSQEFGTVPGIVAARALVLENQAFWYAPEEHGWWSQFTRDAFYVRTEQWKTDVVRRGLRVTEQAIARSRAVARADQHA